MAKRKPAKVAQRVDLRLGEKHARWLKATCEAWQAPPTIVLRMMIAQAGKPLVEGEATK